ncbi:MAG: SAM-dependent methyltransferase [Flavobacteriales bacterium]|jgi:transcriptional antiterminator Rof (Rho-off)|nr:SAM-dependent methyltransferase [Flavobacteriales bacterium]MBP8879185.1 SAM-dependent methyltransferase [Flavobacteriales bacterium]MBP9177993.1 SAM-dependent methyltransferase [Flavobacteriales bacterium]
MDLDHDFWDARYAQERTGWDLGGPSTPLKTYIDQLTNKDLRILIPGGGRSYEAEYAQRSGFTKVFVIDLTERPFKDLISRYPDFPVKNLIVGDLFEHEGTYDRILEQTFFCALDPAMRDRYVEHMHHLLAPQGKLVGVLFDEPMDDGPPFGGSKEEYVARFGLHFKHVSFTPCYNSITPRMGRELWMTAQRVDHIPIDCNLYDRYEEAATLKRTVHLTMQDGQRFTGRIMDLFVRDHIEWLRMDTEHEIRLDHIMEMEVDVN